MDRERFSYLAHAGLEVANPLGLDVLMRAAAIARPRAGQRALDIGCGKGALLLRLAREHEVYGLGVERAALVHAAAEAAAVVEGAGHVEVRCADAAEVVGTLRDASVDLGICIGSGHALGGLSATLDALARVVRPGGHVLIGEGYWRKRPSAEYLAGLGGTEEESRSHAANVELGVAKGMTPLYATTATEREWDGYEWAYSRNIELYAAENPEDPAVPAMLQRIRAWRRLYLEHGRETLGFGLYLFRRP
jgi:SAM-dependent methyltransferase